MTRTVDVYLRKGRVKVRSRDTMGTVPSAETPQAPMPDKTKPATSSAAPVGDRHHVHVYRRGRR